MKRSSRFDEMLLEAVDFGFQSPAQILKTAMYDWLRTCYQIRREEIPHKLATLHQALRYLLGANAETIEKLIAQNLYSKFGLKFAEHENWTLAEYVDEVKRRTSSTGLWEYCNKKFRALRVVRRHLR